MPGVKPNVPHLRPLWQGIHPSVQAHTILYSGDAQSMLVVDINIGNPPGPALEAKPR